MAHELDSRRSPSATALDRAIPADLAGRPSRYPERTAFIDADVDRGDAVVLVSADGRKHVLTAQAPAA
jgi:hypothetical protein